MKRCSKCKQEKPRTEFFANPKSRAKDGLHPYCKSCKRELTRVWRRNHPDKVREYGRKSDRKKRFGPGMTAEVFADMLSTQRGKCAICGGTNASERALSIDHDHRTGSIRGLLCSNCNVGLGFFRDAPELLEKAIGYLKRGL